MKEYCVGASSARNKRPETSTGNCAQHAPSLPTIPATTGFEPSPACQRGTDTVNNPRHRHRAHPLHNMPVIPSRPRTYSRAFLPFPPPSAPHNNHSFNTCSTNSTPQRPNHPHPARHTTAINKYAKSGNLSLLQHAVRRATRDGYVLNAVNYTTIANAHAEHGSCEQAFSVLALMRNTRVRPTNATLRVAVKACERWHNPRRAVDAITETLNWVSTAGVEPCLRSWNLALRCLSRYNARDAIAQIIDKMHADHGAPCPNTRSYNTYVHSFKSNRCLKEAINVFGQMLVGSRAVHPDVVTYNSLLDIAVHAELPFPSLDESKAPKQFVHAILSSMSRRNVSPNLTTETLILRVLCRKGSFPDRQFLWNRFGSLLADRWTRPDKQYLDAVITGFGKVADIDGMHLALTEMAHNGLKSDPLTFRALLLGASHLGDVALAKSIIDTLESNGSTPDAHEYTTAISSCARADPRDPASADSFLQQALDRGIHWTPAMVNAVISSYGDDSTKALELWKKLRACPDRASREVLRARMVYDALMRVCGRQARPDVALRILYAAKKAGHVQSNTTDSRALYGAFRRGSTEAGLDEALNRNPLKRSYVQHLKAECGISRDLDLPIDRIRIKF